LDAPASSTVDQSDFLQTVAEIAVALGELGPFVLCVLLLIWESGFPFARMLLLSFCGDHT
jgi:hypothetical protein